MENLPPSPGAQTLRGISPEIHVLRRRALLARIWFAGLRHPSGFARFRDFGPTGSRFDHHLPGPDGGPHAAERAILYAVEAPDAPIDDEMPFVTAIAEVFQLTRVIDLGSEAPRFAIFQLERDVPLLDLTGFWTTRAGASAALSSGAREVARAWSRDFYEAYPKIEGIRYRSSMSGGASSAVALYERAVSGVAAAPLLDLPLQHPALRPALVRAATRLGYAILPSRR